MILRKLNTLSVRYRHIVAVLAISGGGLTYRDIAKACGVSHTTARRYLLKLKSWNAVKELAVEHNVNTHKLLWYLTDETKQEIAVAGFGGLL